MVMVRSARMRLIGTALLCILLLGACGGSGTPASQLMGGTVAAALPLVGAAVQLRCADGSVFNTTSSYFGTWQVVVDTQPLPCALQASGGNTNGTANVTEFYSVAMSFGVNNITPLTSLVLTRLLGGSPQAWFNNPNFAAVTPTAIQSAQDAVDNALGLTTVLAGSSPLTGYYLDGVLVAFSLTLSNPAVNKSYAQVQNAASSGDFSSLTSFAPTFATVYAALYGK